MNSPIFTVEVVVPTQTKYLRFIGTLGEEIARDLDDYSGNREALANHLNLVLTEATANAIEHCASEHPTQTVRISIHLEKRDLRIRVFDQGQGFDLDSVPSPDMDDPSESGYGIFLIKKLMDSVEYREVEGGNLLEMRKRL